MQQCIDAFPEYVLIFRCRGFPRRYRHLRRSKLRNETSPNRVIPLVSISSSIYFRYFSWSLFRFPRANVSTLMFQFQISLDFLSLDLLHKCAHKCNRKSNDNSFLQYSNIDAIRISIYSEILLQIS